MPEEQRLRLIVYIDNFNLRPFDRNRVMREMRAFIGQKLSRDDQLMLVTYDRELHIRRTFTSDPSLIAAAMLDLEKISAQGVHADSDRRDVLQKINDSQSVAEAEGYAHSYAQSTFNDLSFSIDALKKMVDALAGMPGRKAVLYVSDGLQMIAGQDVFYAVQSKYGEQSNTGTVDARLQHLPPARRADGAGQRQPDHLLHDRRRRPALLRLELGREPGPRPAGGRAVAARRLDPDLEPAEHAPDPGREDRAASPSSTPT